MQLLVLLASRHVVGWPVPIPDGEVIGQLHIDPLRLRRWQAAIREPVGGGSHQWTQVANGKALSRSSGIGHSPPAMAGAPPC
jgi:hypothetical protein